MKRNIHNFASPQGLLPKLVSDPAPVDGDALGAAWETWVDGQLRHAILAARAHRLPEPEVCTTQPRYRQTRTPAGVRWVPCERGWVDRIICLEGGVVLHLELKAVVRQGAHTHRWVLPEGLRADKEKGHQARRLARLAALGHRCGVLLGVQTPEHPWAWMPYLLPAAAAGLPRFASEASATWDELRPYQLPNAQARGLDLHTLQLRLMPWDPIDDLPEEAAP